MSRPQPVLVGHLFPEILHALLELLSDLSEADWRQPTVCAGWSVKDVALHLLGGEVGNLSRRRDGHVVVSSAVESWEQLVAAINDWNETWVQAARRLSPRLLIDLLEFTGEQMARYFQSLDPYEMAGPVAWAGSEAAPVWLDVAREYTERWHHQQHIRDAIGQPGLKGPRYLAPTLRTFVWAMPRVFEAVKAPDETSVSLAITGDSGGRWSVVSQAGAWALYAGAPGEPDAEVVLPEEAAWRLFTRGLGPAEAAKQAALHGDRALGERVFEMVSIIA